MGSKKISKKQKPFSPDQMPEVRLKSRVKTKPHDPSKSLRDPKFIVEALVDCLRHDDTDAFKEILRAHYDAINTAQTLKSVGLSKRTFYNAISPAGNPSLDTIAKMISAIARGTKAS